MRGVTTLTGKAQFELVYQRGRSWVAKEIIIRTHPNGLESTRYGLTASRRVGKAVVRNRIKRRLREILRQIELPSGWDLVIIARAPAANTGFFDLEKSVGKLLVRAGLIVVNNEGNSPGSN